MRELFKSLVSYSWAAALFGAKQALHYAFTVLLETGGPAGAPNRPTCTGGRGDAPVEDWPDDEPPPPRPLDLTALDQRLAERWTRA